MEKRKVFLSYAFHDKHFADMAKKILEAKGYIDKDTTLSEPTQAHSASDIREWLRSEISAADTFILLLSKNVDASKWVFYEAGLADALGKSILVVSQKGSEGAALLQNLSDYKIVELEDAG